MCGPLDGAFVSPRNVVKVGIDKIVALADPNNVLHFYVCVCVLRPVEPFDQGADEVLCSFFPSAIFLRGTVALGTGPAIFFFFLKKMGIRSVIGVERVSTTWRNVFRS